MNIGYKLYKNMMPATAEKAPYLGMAIPAGSLAYDNILKEMIKAGTRMTLPTAKYFLDALYEYAAEAIAAEVVRINIGTVTLFPNIDGSFDSEDADFDPKRNSLYVGASLSQELRDLVAGIAPDFAGDKSVGTVKLRSCMDLGSQVFKTVAGLNAFRLAGENLTVPDGPDESLGFYAKDGVTKVADIEVSETDGGQWIACRLKQGAAAIPKGTYKVRLASHGLDPTDPLTVATLTVTLTEDVPALPEPIYTSDLGEIRVFAAKDSQGDALPDDELNVPDTDAQLVLEGEGLVLTDPDNPTTGIGKAYFKASDSAETCESSLTPLGDGKLALSLGMDSAALEDGSYPNAKYIFFAYKDGESDSLEIPFRLLKQA